MIKCNYVNPQNIKQLCNHTDQKAGSGLNLINCIMHPEQTWSIAWTRETVSVSHYQVVWNSNEKQ